MKANVKNAADPKQVKKAKSVVDEQRRQELFDIRTLTQTPSGRRVIWRILHEFCHIDQSSSDPRSGSATYFNEGARSVGLSLKSDLMEGAFEEYQAMEAAWAAENINRIEDEGDEDDG